jgi:hypothetical protein
MQARKLELHVSHQSSFQLAHFMTVMWCSAVVLKSHAKTFIQRHTFQ